MADSRTKTLMGRLCEHMDYPLLDSIPEDPRPFLQHSTMQYTLSTAKATLNSLRDQGMAGQLRKVLSAFLGTARSGNFDLDAEKVRTITLPEQKASLSSLMTHTPTKEAVLSRLRNGKSWFMVVGYKTCQKARVETKKEGSTTIDVQGTLPVEEAVGAVIEPAIWSLPNVANPQSRAWKEVTWGAVESGFLDDEVIFAVEYREVLPPSFLDRLIHSIKMDKEKLEYEISEGLKTHSEKVAFYGGDKRQVGVSLSDDEEEIVEDSGRRPPTQSQSERDEAGLRERGIEVLNVDNERIPFRPVEPSEAWSAISKETNDVAFLVVVC